MKIYIPVSLLLLLLLNCNNLGEVPELGGMKPISSSSSSLSVILSSSATVITFSTSVDPRTGRSYKTVVINGSEWLAENMQFTAPGGGSVCGNSDSNACDTLGLLYQWKTATGGIASDNVPSGVQGICPDGWHIPSDTEWKILMKIAGDSSAAGFSLKAKFGWGNAGNGDNKLGFTALPAGYIDLDTVHYGFESYAYFWSTTEQDSDNASIWYIGKNNKALFNQPNDKNIYASVRCLRN